MKNEETPVAIKYLPKISVIVSVYKAEPYLHRCVDSIQKKASREEGKR